MKLPLLFTLLLPLTAQEMPTDLPDQEEGYQHIERFIHVLEEVRANHPNAEKLTYERLINHALEGMLGSLDPFSAFYHPETAPYLDPDASADEQFTLPSLGISLGKREGEIYLASVRDYSPAASAGLQRDDLLLKKGDLHLNTLELPDALKALSGQPGESLTLTIFRKPTRQEKTVTLLHAIAKEAALPDHFLLEKPSERKIAYLRLTEFTATAPSELEAALDELEDKGLQSLILDLRGNPGGLLDASVKILGLFLPPNTEVVTTQGRSPRAQTSALTTPERQRVKRDYPLVVLIDRHSASASELTAGALIDLQRATIIGETSYGKGSVQNIINQGNGTALRLTFATYHTPSGKTPHLVGITPDIPINITDQDRVLFELFKKRQDATAEQKAQLKQWTDPVLKAAIDHLSKN